MDEPLVTFSGSAELLSLVGATVLVDRDDFVGVHHAGRALAEDFGHVTGGSPSPFEAVGQTITTALRSAIIIGSIDSCLIRRLATAGKIQTSHLQGKWETFLTVVVDYPLEGCEKALVIAGSDKRGAIFGAYTLSSQIGVSPYVSLPSSLRLLMFQLVLVGRRPCETSSRYICLAYTDRPRRAERPISRYLHQ